MSTNGSERPTIKSFVSAIGIESMDFLNGGIQLKGKVEHYLGDVLKCITDSIKAKTIQSKQEFHPNGDARFQWIVKNLA